MLLSVIIKSVVSATSEAEYLGFFLRKFLLRDSETSATTSDTPQGRTTTPAPSELPTTDTVKIRKSKAIDLRYHWIEDPTK